jgi:hypothetical protein
VKGFSEFKLQLSLSSVDRSRGRPTTWRELGHVLGRRIWQDFKMLEQNVENYEGQNNGASCLKWAAE